jgi:hypothetical protein
MRPALVSLALALLFGSGGAALAKSPMHPTLYERLGGKPAIKAVVDDFDTFKVPAREQAELLALLGPMRGQIVERR